MLNKLRKKINHLISGVIVPGFEGLSLFRVLHLFFKGIKDGVLHVRASSVAYNTILAFPPVIIFFFTLIPYIPVPNFDVQLMDLFANLLPINSFKALEETLYEVVTHRSGGLMSFGFLASFIFSTNGMHNLIVSFNATSHDTESRNWFVIRSTSFLMVLLQALLVTVAVALLFYGKKGLNLLVENDIVVKNITYYLLLVGKWVVIIILFFSAISSLYLMAPVKKENWRFLSGGAILATILCLLASLAFSYFVNNFGQYNKLYGSVGSLMASMLWIYLNCFSVILGFELNASIKSAARVHEKTFE